MTRHTLKTSLLVVIFLLVSVAALSKAAAGGSAFCPEERRGRGQGRPREVRRKGPTVRKPRSRPPGGQTDGWNAGPPRPPSPPPHPKPPSGPPHPKPPSGPPHPKPPSGPPHYEATIGSTAPEATFATRTPFVATEIDS